MTDQLTLDLAPPPTPGTVGQLRELPGTEWEHIFDMPAPNDFKCPQPEGEARADRDQTDRRPLGTPSRGDSLRRDGQADRAYPSRATGNGHH